MIDDNERKLLYLIIAIAVLVACITIMVGIMVGVVFAAAAATGLTTVITMAAEAALTDRPLTVIVEKGDGSLSLDYSCC